MTCSLADNYIALDTETTGLDIDAQIVEVALVGMSHGKVLWSFSSLLHPMGVNWSSPSVKEAMEVNGIQANDLCEAPGFVQVFPVIEHALALSTLVVGHNVRFDLEMLVRQHCGVHGKMGHTFPHVRHFCTMALDRVLNPDISGRSLESVRAKWNVDRGSDPVHRAASDAIVSGKIFAAMCEQIVDQEYELQVKQRYALEQMDAERAAKAAR